MEETKRETKNHFRSEFSMGQLDFERFHVILEWLDGYSYAVGKYDQASLSYLQEYLSMLKTLRKNISSLLSDEEDVTYDQQFKEAQEAIYETYNKSKNGKVMIKAHLKLEKLHGDLLKTRQLVGLGILVSKKQSASGKMKDLLGSGRNASK